jgi:hypothetical protein
MRSSLALPLAACVGTMACADSAPPGWGDGPESFRSLIPLTIRGEDLSSADTQGTIFVRIQGQNAGQTTMWRAVIDGETWLRAIRARTVGEFDINYFYPWKEEHSFSMQNAPHYIHRISDENRLCQESCTFDVYYTDQLITDIGNTELLWNAAPERWRRAEFEYRWDDRITASSLQSYDEETGMGVVNIGMVTVDPSGDELRVTMEPQTLHLYDLGHSYRNSLDGGEVEGDEQQSDAGRQQ